jgi:hypothetical protein
MNMSNDPSRQLSDAQIEALIERAAARAADDAVQKAFRNLGINIASPADLRAWHADTQWTRSAREGSGRLSMSLKTSVLGTLATAVLLAVWTVVKAGGAGGAP